MAPILWVTVYMLTDYCVGQLTTAGPIAHIYIIQVMHYLLFSTNRFI